MNADVAGEAYRLALLQGQAMCCTSNNQHNFQVSLKCTNFDTNTNIFINFIPNNESFVP